MALRTRQPLSSSPAAAPVHFPVSEPVALLTRVATFCRLVHQVLVNDNPLWWSYRHGAWNAQADLEGPYFLIGAPDRTVAPGKAILPTLDELQSAPTPFLLILTVLSPSGAPLPNVPLDFWQADSTGSYAFDTYALRGRAHTDARGRVEVLTVPPGRYGPLDRERAGHFHVRVAGTTGEGGEEWEGVTTQVYLCQGNDVGAMGKDFLNFARTPRPNNRIEAFCAPSTAPLVSSKATPASEGSIHFMDLPPLDKVAHRQLAESVAQWNEALALSAGGLKIGAMGEKELRLNVRKGWW